MHGLRHALGLPKKSINKFLHADIPPPPPPPVASPSYTYMGYSDMSLVAQAKILSCIDDTNNLYTCREHGQHIRGDA